MTAVHPIVSPWGRFGLYSFFIDAPEPAIVDAGIATSPRDGVVPALEQLGRRIEDVRWILLTHGHIDHVGGAWALWEMTGRKAEVVIHKADAPLLRSRQAHVDDYTHGRGRYIDDPQGATRVADAGHSAISGEMEPTRIVSGGERILLGGGVTATVHAIPGHTPGSVAYVLDETGDVFVGDAVQVHGAANHFPGYADPDAYRDSLVQLRDEIRPARLHLGHPYRTTDGAAYGVDLDEREAREALTESIDIERVVRAAAERAIAREVEEESVLDLFDDVARDLGYAGDPTLEPSPFFTTMHAYRSLLHGRK